MISSIWTQTKSFDWLPQKAVLFFHGSAEEGVVKLLVDPDDEQSFDCQEIYDS